MPIAIKDSIITDYERVLAGQIKRLPNTYFRGEAYNKEVNALTVIRYAFNNILELSADQALLIISDDLLKQLKINTLIKYIAFPYNLHKDALFYVVFKAYPGEIPKIKEQTALYIYQKVLAGDYKMPATFFDGEEGKQNAITLLRYQLGFLGLKGYELYEFFSNKKKLEPFLRDTKLKKVIGKAYRNGLDWLHDSLPEGNELWYRYFKFLGEFQ